MSFLDPMSALVGAAIAGPALLILYLLKLRRRPVRVSSTLLWRSASEDLQANVPLRWLRASWILLLHLLIVGLLVTALGRPVLSATGHERARVVLLIDRSASMSCRDGPDGRTRLDAARARANELAERSIDSGAAVAVVSFASRAAVETGFTRSRGTALAAIGQIGPSDQPGGLAAAIRVVDSLLADSGEEQDAARASLCLISDGSFADDGAPGPASAALSFLPVGVPGVDNVGIVALAARRDYDDPGTVRVFVRLISARGDELDVPVSIALGDGVIDRRAVRLVAPGGVSASDGPGTPRSAGASVAVAEGVTTFEIKSPAGGVAAVRLDRPDALDSDNSGALVLPAARRASIVLVKPSDGDERPTLVPPWLLEGALSELDAASFRTMSAEGFERLAAAGSLAGVDLYVFDRVTPRAVPPGPSLSFGAGLPTPGLELEDPDGRPTGGRVLAWERDHPLLRDVALDQVIISRTMLAGRERPDSRVKVLATGPDGPVMILGADGPYRRLVVAFDAAASNWPLQVSFPVFLATAVDYLTLRGEESSGRSFATGEPVEIVAPGGASQVELRLESPAGLGRVAPGPEESSRAGGVVRVAIPRGRAGGRVPVGLVERAGVYRIVPPGSEPEVAVNVVDALESACAVAGSVKLGGATVSGESTGPVAREIWPWFLLAAGVLLMVEWGVYAARARA